MQLHHLYTISVHLLFIIATDRQNVLIVQAHDGQALVNILRRRRTHWEHTERSGSSLRAHWWSNWERIRSEWERNKRVKSVLYSQFSAMSQNTKRSLADHSRVWQGFYSEFHTFEWSLLTTLTVSENAWSAATIFVINIIDSMESSIVFSDGI